MAGPYYVRSGDGSDASDGLTWANAKATLAGALAVAAAGERIWVSQAHAETQATAMTLTSAGTVAAPIEILCGNDAAEPPTALATGATISTTGTSNIIINGGLYAYGLTFQIGSGAGGPLLQLSGSAGTTGQIYDTCVFSAVATGAVVFFPGAGVGTSNRRITWINCSVLFSAVTQGIRLFGYDFWWFGGSAAATGTVPTSLLVTAQRSGVAHIRGVDLSTFASGKSLINVGTASAITCAFEQVKLGAGVALTTGTPPGPGVTVLLDNSDSADTQYRMQRHDYEGDAYSETTIVRTGGASNGTTPLSHKVVSSAGARFTNPMYGPEIPPHNVTVGSAVTATVEIVHDSVTALTDAEVWLEVEYLGTTGFPLSLFANDRAADILATPAAQTTSTVAWTTVGMANENKQKLEVTFTAQEIGVVRCRVALAKPSYTIYYCPKVDIA